MNYEVNLTKDFKLKEFIYSRFYNEEIQKRVIEEFEKNIDELLPKIQKLANQLQTLSDYICRKIYINIAFRPLFWEYLMGRSGESMHTLCIACDIVVKELTPKEVHEAIEFLISEGCMLQGGLGLYDTFVHYDFRGKKARW